MEMRADERRQAERKLKSVARAAGLSQCLGRAERTTVIVGKSHKMHNQSSCIVWGFLVGRVKDVELHRRKKTWCEVVG